MKESEIRPQKLFNQYLELAKKDNEIFFSDHSRFTEIPCPSCGNEKQMPGLKKFVSLHDHRPRCMICITARPNR
jgi:hypothetical protein